MVTWVPGGPLEGDTSVMTGTMTSKETALDQTPPCRTWARPEFEPVATVATISVSLQLDTAPYVLPSHTAPVPGVEPKPEPETVTEVPAEPLDGETVVIVGGEATVNARALLATLSTVTTTLPEAAPLGTAIRMMFALQNEAVPAGVPLKVTVLEPWLEPKLAPVSVTRVPTDPAGGQRLPTKGPLPRIVYDAELTVLLSSPLA